MRGSRDKPHPLALGRPLVDEIKSIALFTIRLVGALEHVPRRKLGQAERHERRQDAGIAFVAGVEECASVLAGGREFGERCDCGLGGRVGACGVDCNVLGEALDGDC